jgi:small-conductance mechanosensitive channel
MAADTAQFARTLPKATTLKKTIAVMIDLESILLRNPLLDNIHVHQVVRKLLPWTIGILVSPKAAPARDWS